MINYVISFLLGGVIYLVAIRYLKNFCPPSKLFKFIIYMCISTLAVPVVNFIHPIKSGESSIFSPIMNDISGTENSMGSDWEQAQQKANTLVNGGSTQPEQQTNYQNDYNDDQTTSQQSDEQSQSIIIGRNGEVLS
jgi:hypothetical protein